MKHVYKIEEDIDSISAKLSKAKTVVHQLSEQLKREERRAKNKRKEYTSKLQY